MQFPARKVQNMSAVWCKFHKENASPGILYHDGVLRNVEIWMNDSTFTFTISQVLGQDISIYSLPFKPILRKLNILLSAINTFVFMSNF